MSALATGAFDFTLWMLFEVYVVLRVFYAIEK